MHESEKWKWSRPVVSDSSRPHGLQPIRLLRPWDFPGKRTGVGCHRLLRFQPLTMYILQGLLQMIPKPNSIWEELERVGSEVLGSNLKLITHYSDLAEKAMAPHSSTLAWKIPWTEEPGRLQSMGSLRVRHDWATSFSLFTFIHWRREWQPTPVFWPGESQGQWSLVGCRLWGHTELDTTEAT